MTVTVENSPSADPAQGQTPTPTDLAPVAAGGGPSDLVEKELLVEEDLLVEDVSIDGMCGVY